MPVVKKMSNVSKVASIRAPESWTPLRRASHPPSARSLLLTILGEFVLPDGGQAWTATLVDALGRLGVEEPSARQALARSGTRGLLVPQRLGRRTLWTLTERADRILREGAERIYSFGRAVAAWDGTWLLVLTTVPEPNRHLRAGLRARMVWQGFGALGPGAWVSPWADRESVAVRILQEMGLEGASMSWVGRPGRLGAVEDRVAEIWDLAAVERDYVEFLAGAEEEAPVSPEEAFVSLTRLVHDWRHFPASDPGLPDRLLPASWPAPAAADAFRARRAEWSPAALEWWRSR